VEGCVSNKLHLKKKIKRSSVGLSLLDYSLPGKELHLLVNVRLFTIGGTLEQRRKVVSPRFASVLPRRHVRCRYRP
jgi:hypothetical protein